MVLSVILVMVPLLLRRSTYGLSSGSLSSPTIDLLHSGEGGGEGTGLWSLVEESHLVVEADPKRHPGEPGKANPSKF